MEEFWEKFSYNRYSPSMDEVRAKLKTGDEPELIMPELKSISKLGKVWIEFSHRVLVPGNWTN